MKHGLKQKKMELIMVNVQNFVELNMHLCQLQLRVVIRRRLSRMVN